MLQSQRFGREWKSRTQGERERGRADDDGLFFALALSSSFNDSFAHLVFFPPRHLSLSSLKLQLKKKKKNSTDLEWKLTYVGSAESEKYDQVLDSVLVGPVFPGQYRFVFQVRRSREL